MGNPLFAKKKAVVAPSGDETVEEKASSPLKWNTLPSERTKGSMSLMNRSTSIRVKALVQTRRKATSIPSS